eukprot:5351722-Prorocentrum_lima.AAC.1
MTSSLVGSEMCIRDRKNRDLLVSSGAFLKMDLTTLRSTARWEAALMAVSYTHLTLPTICSV